MKPFLIVGLMACLTLGGLAGCGGADAESSAPAAPESEASGVESSASEPSPATGIYTDGNGNRFAWKQTSPSSMTITGLENPKNNTVLEVPPSIEGVTVRYLRTGAFENHEELQQVILPEGILTIGIRAFQNCSSLTQINIPDTCTNIDDGAFSNTGFSEFTIPAQVVSLGSAILSNCEQLKSVYLAGDREEVWLDTVYSPSLDEVVLEKVPGLLATTPQAKNLTVYLGDGLQESSGIYYRYSHGSYIKMDSTDPASKGHQGFVNRLKAEQERGLENIRVSSLDELQALLQENQDATTLAAGAPAKR